VDFVSWRTVVASGCIEVKGSGHYQRQGLNGSSSTRDYRRSSSSVRGVLLRAIRRRSFSMNNWWPCRSATVLSV